MPKIGATIGSCRVAYWIWISIWNFCKNSFGWWLRFFVGISDLDRSWFIDFRGVCTDGNAFSLSGGYLVSASTTLIWAINFYGPADGHING